MQLTRIATRGGARRFALAAAGPLIALCAAFALVPHARAASGPHWSSAVAISPANQPDPTRGAQLNSVAVNATGLTLAAWDQFSYTGSGGATIGVAVQSGGRWGAPFTVSGTSGYSTTPTTAVGNDGTLAVSWTYQDPMSTTVSPQQKVQVAVLRPTASGWTTYTLAQAAIGGVAIITPVPLGIDTAGNLTAAWSLWDGTRHLVQAATLRAGSTAWLPSATVSAPTHDGLYLSLAVNAAGDAAIAYSLSPYTTYATGTSAQYVLRTGPDGGWSAPVTVSETLMSNVGYITSPRVALDANRRATVTWFGYGVEATRQRPDGTWTTPATILLAPNPVSSYMSPDMAVDDAGYAIVVCSIFDATVGVDRASVWVTRGMPDGSWTTQQRLTDPTVPVDAYATRAAVAPDGSLAMVGWIDHYHATVQVSRWTGTAWGAPDTVGRGTAFSSFQEVLGLDIGSSGAARAIWKNTAKGGTRTMAASYP